MWVFVVLFMCMRAWHEIVDTISMEMGSFLYPSLKKLFYFNPCLFHCLLLFGQNSMVCSLFWS